jgi:putative hemolysin
MKMVSVVTAPFIWLLTNSTEFLLDILKIRPSSDGKITEEEIKAIIKQGTETGEVQEIEQDIVERVLHWDRKINSLMTHRKSVVYLPLHSNKKEVKEFMRHELHSVLPVYNSNYDDVGVVNLKNIFAHIDDDFNLSDLMTAPYDGTDDGIQSFGAV